MKPEHRKMVFEKFYRAQSGLVHATKGFGLGLSYTKAVIDLHQGSIDVLSEFGKGSIFIVRFRKPRIIRKSKKNEYAHKNTCSYSGC